MHSSEEKKNSQRKFWRSQPLPDQKLVVEWDTKIRDQIAASQHFLQAAHVGIYSARFFEVNLFELWTQFPQKCVFPKVKDKNLNYYSIDTVEDLKPGFAAISEPTELVQNFIEFEKGDLVLIPGLVFDIYGGRLGSGAGFYDRYLSARSSVVQRWGVCWDCRLSKDKLAQSPFDVRMDCIVTEKHTLKIC